MRISKLMAWVCLAICVQVGCQSFDVATGKVKTKVVSQAERLKWFNDARFGMFIHWGLYSVPAGVWEGKKYKRGVEWIQNFAKIHPDRYEKLIAKFNPVKFDAKAWVKTAKDAGMKYIVITTKHHDGFALFDSKVSDFDVMATPFKRDIMKELIAACRAEGIRIGWYHSIMDWHHKDYLPRHKWDDRRAGEMEVYKRYLYAQVKEILTQYGKIDMLWFDGEWEKSWTHEDGVKMYDFAMKLQPEMIINNRVDKGRHAKNRKYPLSAYAGDYGTPEQKIPAKGLGAGVAWESCMTMNGTWGYSGHDLNWKFAKTLVRNLINTSSKGGNFLLNVGPTGLGEIPEASLTRLAKLGKWLDVYGSAIYKTTATPFETLTFSGRCTVSHLANGNDRLNLFIFSEPKNGELELLGLRNKIVKVQYLDSGKAVDFKRKGKAVVLDVSDLELNRYASVLTVEVKGKVVVAKKKH